MEIDKKSLPLNSSRPLRRRIFNRVFAAVYSGAVSALLYHHVTTLLRPTTVGTPSFLISLTLLAADLILAFMWLNSQAFRMNPVVTTPLPENLLATRTEADFPALDVFICTADPYKEPPMGVATTALSVMAYDYPPEKLSVYVSDDGGSEVTLFALREAAEFGKAWLPFCRENRVMDRCPESFFGSGHATCPEALEIQGVYEDMKKRVEDAVMLGDHWTEPGFTSGSHPSVIQVLSQSSEDKDGSGNPLPNLIYVSRNKVPSYPHNFKAGALNVLLRVSSLMTKSPIILTLDCDMISNDPSTPHKILCYFLDNKSWPDLGYVQFPVCFRGVNAVDIYGSELKRPFHLNPLGMNGLLGPDYFGSGTFFKRRVFHGSPTKIISLEMPELGFQKPINGEAILGLAHRVARYDYERQTGWGIEVGFRYGSLVEDYYTGYRLHCEGWKSVYFSPKRPAFLSDMPISLNDMVTQQKRWSIGLLEVLLSKFSPLTYGTRFLGSLMAQCYSYYAFGPFWSFSIIVYAFLPQLAMLNNVSIFPKVFEPWFLVYTFLFLSAYGQDLIEFILAPSGGMVRRWWNDQRIWLVKGLSSDLFGTLEYISNRLGISTRRFSVTNKADDGDQRKRYNEGKFEFGVTSPMFVPLSTAAIVNGVAFCWGILQGDWLNMGGQIGVACFGVVNSWPVYEAMLVRSDEGKMPAKITFISIILAWLLCKSTSYIM